MQNLKRLPKKYIAIGVAIVVIGVTVVGLWPRTIMLTYGQQLSCIDQPMFFGGVLKSKDSDSFVVTPEGNTGLVSRELCARALTAPSTGDHTVLLSLFGLPIGKQMTIHVPEHPVASTEVLSSPIPVSKPIRIPLDQPDQLFAYRMKVGEASTNCLVKSVAIECDITKLNLDQGGAYTATLDRMFDGKKSATIVNRQITTLSAVSVKEASIKRDETVYSKVKSIDVTLDKELIRASATLEKIDGSTRSPVPVQTVFEGDTLHVTWTEDQERQKEYELIVDRVEAKDGSSFVEPYVLPFKLSGGPKVTGVSIPKTGVPLGSVATITFDQPLLDKQDVAKSIGVAGGAAVTSVQGNQLRVSLANVAKCADFSIKVNDALQSNHEVSGGSAWSFTGRTICYSIETIGYSSKGRAITAYTFGNGPSTVLYTGAIHGNEVSTRSLMLRWIDELEANVRAIPGNKSIVVVPAINPDGVAAGTRVSGANVDLNRNFATADWKKDITTVTNAPFPRGGGSSPLSEPETKAIANLVGRLRPSIVLSYHSIGGLLQANMASNSTAKAAQYSSLSGYRNATGGSAFEYSITGTADDYYAERYGVGSIVIELGSHTYHQFERNQKAMWAMMQ